MNTLESIKVNPSFLLHHFLHDGPQASLIRLPSTSLHHSPGPFLCPLLPNPPPLSPPQALK